MEEIDSFVLQCSETQMKTLEGLKDPQLKSFVPEVSIKYKTGPRNKLDLSKEAVFFDLS